VGGVFVVGGGWLGGRSWTGDVERGGETGDRIEIDNQMERGGGDMWIGSRGGGQGGGG